MPYRVVLVDDHPLYRIGIESALIPHTDFQVVGEASDAPAAYAVVGATRPDVVVLDLSLPGADGITIARKILKSRHARNVLVLTMHKGGEYLRHAIAAGVRGYALKDEPPSEIVAAVRAVASGALYISREVASAANLTDGAAGPGSGGSLESLSGREKEIFSLIVKGYSSQRIADELAIRLKTVETHRTHINQKLGVHSTGEIVRLAALRGMLTA